MQNVLKIIRVVFTLDEYLSTSVVGERGKYNARECKLRRVHVSPPPCNVITHAYYYFHPIEQT